MSEKTASGTGPSQRGVETGVALATMAFGGVVIFGSLQVGIDWGIEGPRAGFFPFYIGLCIVLASLINLGQILYTQRSGKLFAEWGQLRRVLSVVIPTAVYVALVPTIGIYVASMLLIAVFMKWLGRYGWSLVLPIAVGVPILVYIAFEKWFLIPLPKGPLEELLGL